jgi:hypothetical protein
MVGGSTNRRPRSKLPATVKSIIPRKTKSGDTTAATTFGYWKLHHLLGDSKNCAAAAAVIQKPRWLLRSDSKILHGYLKTHLGVSKTCNLEIQKTESAFQKTIVGSFETPQLQVEFPITRNGCSNGIPTFSVSKHQH